MFYIVSSPLFGGFITFIIILNTIVLAMDKSPAWPDNVDKILKTFNTIFTVVFTIEMVFKLVGLGLRGYCSDNMNLFDGIIVIISLVETVMAAVSGSKGGGGPFGALRAFRLFRIFKVFRSGDFACF